MEYKVMLGWDSESHVWTAENDEIPFALCFPSLDGLIEQTRYVAAEVLDLNGKQTQGVLLNFYQLNRREQVYT